MNDVWCFDFASSAWSKVDMPEDSWSPAPRSGHTSVCHGQKMYIFGGIYELTHELNDLFCFDFESKCFKKIDGEDNINEEAGASGEQTNPDGRRTE